MADPGGCRVHRRREWRAIIGSTSSASCAALTIWDSPVFGPPKPMRASGPSRCPRPERPSTAPRQRGLRKFLRTLGGPQDLSPDAFSRSEGLGADGLACKSGSIRG